MTDVEKCVSSAHIQKLGHSLQEIRERALKNIVSKFEHGFTYDNDLARSKEILQKLFEWFLFEECSHEDVVLKLIKRILQTESGSILLKHYGPEPIVTELAQVKSCIESIYHSLVDDIVEFVKRECNSRMIVPPLQSDMPLSYRSYESSRPITVESTASPIEGFVRGDSSLDQQTGICKSTSDGYERVLSSEALPRYTLHWQTLVKPDQHVLQSVEDSLRHPPQPSALLHSCEFFVDIMIHDFPAEVFLQRPGIVLMFQKLIVTTSSTRVATSMIKCVLKLTELLKTRINYYSDPGTHNLKHVKLQVHSGYCSPSNTAESEMQTCSADGRSDNSEDSVLLQARQMSLPYYCLSTMKCVFDYLYVKPKSLSEDTAKKKHSAGVNAALSLITNLIDLLCVCITEKIWTLKTIVAEFFDVFNDVLVKFGETIENLRLEVLSSDYEKTFRTMHLHLLSSCTYFLKRLVPIDNSNTLLPKNLKSALSFAILDLPFSHLYPGVHEKLLAFVQKFAGCSIKYDVIKEICTSMTASVHLLKKHKSLSVLDCITSMKESLKSLEFHKNLSLLKIFVDLCASKLPMHLFKEDVLKTVEEITLFLLAHNDPNVKLEMYKLCHKKIIAAIGPKLNTSKVGAPGSQILFLTRPEVLIEIALHGLISDNIELQTCAEDMLIHILKCKILISNDIWNSIVEALIPVIPVLSVYADGKTVLGRTVVSMLDPDRATSLNLSTLEIIKGNLLLLFNKDPLIREEGVSRLSWMLVSNDGERELLPRLNNLHDRVLSTVCKVDHLFDLNKIRSPQQFYQPSSLHQVLQLVNSDNIEPIIRRSALTQIAVMMEDPLIHATFLQNKGTQIVISVMRSALTDDCYKDYPDSVIPCVSIMKNVCLYNPSIRHELSTRMFLFCTDERMKQEGSTLLILLLLNYFVTGTPLKSDLAISRLFSERLCVPFSCKTCSSVSKHTPKSVAAVILEDQWSLSSLQIHWNAEWFGGFGELLSREKINFGDSRDFNDVLRMSEIQLNMMRQSSLKFCINKYLDGIQNGTDHQNIVNDINKLTECLELYAVVKEDCTFENLEFLSLLWKQTFLRFLNMSPSSESDVELLTCVLRFLNTLLLFYKYVDDCWIVSSLKEKTNPLLEALHINMSHDAIEMKNLNKEFLQLIANCASYEQRYLDFHSNNSSSSWSYMVDIIAENLKISDAQHFYNLAYLNCLLSCLVHLTATLGWSRSKIGSSVTCPPVQLVTSLCEMIDAFHSSKGASASDSFMGLSITRHAVLILNHVLVEMQHFNVKDWDSCFIKEESGLENSLSNLHALCMSRDMVLRAGVFQLFSGLAMSGRCATELVQELKNKGGGFWQNCLNMLMQLEEANIVKENIAVLLANVCSHTIAVGHDGCVLDAGVAPTNLGKQVDTPTQTVMKLLDDVNFYKELDMVLSCLYPSRTFLFDENNVNKQSKVLQADAMIRNDGGEYAYVNIGDRLSSRTDFTNNNSFIVMSTPSYIKALTSFIFNLLLLAPSRLSACLQEHDLIKSFFKCLCIPELELQNTRDLALYCDILEMNAGICSVLTKAVSVNAACLGVVLRARDSLNVLLTLLNPSIYHTTLPQLLYLRNKLWTEAFALIAVALNSDPTSALNVISSALSDCGQVPFLQTLYEAISSKNSSVLQQSALSSLTSLLHTRVPSKDKLMRNLLDKTRTPRTPSIEENLQSPNKIKSSSSSSEKRNLECYYLEKLYGTETNVEQTESICIETGGLMAGAVLCKILIHLLEIATVKHDVKKSLVINTLTSVLCVSHEAKKFALENGLLEKVVQQLREFHLKLSLDSVEALRRVTDRKRLTPVLKEMGALLSLLTNFMFGESTAKSSASKLGLADLLHKLWAWLMTQKELLIDALKLLCNYTTDCLTACQSLPLTSSVAGSGPRKVPSNVSLLHAIISLVSKEMDQISRTHDLTILQLCFHLLENSCSSVECRIILSKANLLQCLTRLHPAITKKQKPWECVELIWLEFLQTFTSHPEGQACVTKISDVLELVIVLTTSMRSANRQAAMIVLRNVSFYQCNRPRLLTSVEFLNILESKLASGSLEEKNLVVTIMWSLAANNQKAKLIFKCAGLDRKLQDTLKILHLTKNVDINHDDLERMHYMLNLLRDNDKCR